MGRRRARQRLIFDASKWWSLAHAADFPAPRCLKNAASISTDGRACLGLHPLPHPPRPTRPLAGLWRVLPAQVGIRSPGRLVAMIHEHDGLHGQMSMKKPRRMAGVVVGSLIHPLASGAAWISARSSALSHLLHSSIPLHSSIHQDRSDCI